MKYLHDIGIRDDKSPEGNYVFKQWTVQPGGTLSTPVMGTLNLPKSYLSQLAST